MFIISRCYSLLRFQKIDSNNLHIKYVIVFQILNSGPHAIAKAKLTYSWPAWLSSSMTSPLLYLYDFQCSVSMWSFGNKCSTQINTLFLQPPSICKCKVEDKVDPFNISHSRTQVSSNVKLIFPPKTITYNPKTVKSP